MEENEVLNPDVETEAQDQGDAFLDGWEKEGLEGSDAADEQDAPEQDTDEGAPTSEDDPATAEAEEHGEATAEPSAEQTPPVQQWEVVHLGERKTISAEDITPELLQKGMDYDRVSQKYDATKPIMSVIADMARRSNMNMEDYVRYVRTEAKKSEGMTEDEAKRAVELEDRESAVAAKEETVAKEATAREAGEAKVRADIESFAKAFPDIYEKARSDPQTIPESVWAEVNAGMPLAAAYARHVVAQATAASVVASERIAAAEANQKNAARAAGSMKSAGSDAKNADAFLAGFEE